MQFLPELIDTLGQFNTAIRIAGDPVVWSALFETLRDLAKFMPGLNSGMRSLTAALTALGKLTGGFKESAADQEKARQASVDLAKSYKSQGTELGQLQASAVLATQRMNELMKSGDEKGASKAREELRALQDQIKSLRVTTAAMQGPNLEVSSQVVDPEAAKKAKEALKDQKAAVESLKTSLRDRQLQFRLEGLEGVSRDIEKVRQEFAKMRREAAEPFGGNQNASALKGTMAQLAVQEAREIARIKAEAAKEARKKAADDAKEERKQAEADVKAFTELSIISSRAAARAEVAAMIEGAEKKRATRDLELQDLEDNYRKQVESAKGNIRLITQLTLDAQRQSRALQEKWAQEDEKEARDAAFRVVDVQLAARTKLAQRRISTADSSSEKLAAERYMQQVLEAQAATYQNILRDAQQMGLTEDQRTGYAEKLRDTQFAIEDSQRNQREIGKQIIEDAQKLSESFGELNRILTGETVDQTQALADATRDVADAYRAAEPSLQKFRDGQLTPNEIKGAQDAFDKLTSSLEKQQQVLKEMTEEYDRQRSALGDLFGTLKGFGVDLGDEEMLTRSLGIDQENLKASTEALQNLLKSGTFTASQLSEGAQKVKSDFDALKSSYEEIGKLKAQPFLDKAALLEAGGDQEGAAAAKEAAEKIVSEYEKAFKTATNDITPLMQDVGRAGLQAADDVTELGKRVQEAEKQVKESSQKMRESFTGVFAGLPDQASKAGVDAGRRFVESMSTQLKGMKIPAVTVAAAPGTRAATTGGNVYHININGRTVNGQTLTQDEAAMLDRLGNLLDAKCRRKGS